MATAIRTVKAHLVQTSPDFTTWTTQTGVRCTECSEGAGQIVGSATLVRLIGTAREPGATGSPASQTPLTGLVGQWARVLIADAGGAITVSGTNYAALWHGTIDAQRISDTGGGTGTQSFACAGLAAHLGRIALINGWTEAIGTGGTTVADYVLRVPVFNTADGGGASTPTYSIDGVSCKVFDTYSGTKWTAKQILQLLLASHGRWDDLDGGFTGNLSWTLSAGTLLDYEAPTLDVNGMTLLDAVNTLISPRRGLMWRVTVSGTTATINVLSIAASAITVAASGSYSAYTLPAATDTSTPDLSGIWSSGVELTEDQSSTYDHIAISGARPWVGLTVAYDPANATSEAKSLVQAWTNAQETSWNTAAGPTTDGVWRSFKLNPLWDGRQYGGSTYGLRQNLTLDANGDLTGERVYDSAVDFPPGVLSIDGELPCGVGFAYDPTGPRQDIMAFWKPTGSSAWYDMDGPVQELNRSVTVANGPGVVHIGSPSREKAGSTQQRNKYQLMSAAGTINGVILVTLGVREPDPLMVTWTRASASWPRTNPRTLSVHLPNAEQWVMLSGTVKGVSGGSLTTESSETTIRDDVPSMRSYLAFLRAYFGEPARALSWTDRGLIEYGYGTGAPAPGTLVTTATLGTGSTTINAVLTRRTWRLDESGYGTSYTTERIVPDIEAIR